jgi:hypothetical protein
VLANRHVTSEIGGDNIGGLYRESMTSGRAILIPQPTWSPPRRRYVYVEPSVVELLDLDRCEMVVTPRGMTSPGPIVIVCDTAVLLASGAQPERLTHNPVAQQLHAQLCVPERRQAILDMAEILSGPVLVFGAEHDSPPPNLVDMAVECWRQTVERHRHELRVVR